MGRLTHWDLCAMFLVAVLVVGLAIVATQRDEARRQLIIYEACGAAMTTSPPPDRVREGREGSPMMSTRPGEE